MAAGSYRPASPSWRRMAREPLADAESRLLDLRDSVGGFVSREQLEHHRQLLLRHQHVVEWQLLRNWWRSCGRIAGQRMRPAATCSTVTSMLSTKSASGLSARWQPSKFRRLPIPGLLDAAALSRLVSATGPSAASVGGLVGYDFGPVDLQVWVTDTIASQNFAEGAGTMNVFTRLGFRLWAPEAARPLVAKN